MVRDPTDVARAASPGLSGVARDIPEAYCTGKVVMTSWIRNIDWPDAGKSVALIALIFAVFWLMASLLGV